MFTSINKLFAFIISVIDILDIFANMGTKRAKHLSAINDHDIAKGQDKLALDLATYKAKNKTKLESIIDPAEFKRTA